MQRPRGVQRRRGVRVHLEDKKRSQATHSGHQRQQRLYSLHQASSNPAALSISSLNHHADAPSLAPRARRSTPVEQQHELTDIHAALAGTHSAPSAAAGGAERTSVSLGPGGIAVVQVHRQIATLQLGACRVSAQPPFLPMRVC